MITQDHKMTYLNPRGFSRKLTQGLTCQDFIIIYNPEKPN